jgi:3-dehydroquinate synthase/2-deoxy-scyllo-inosose synthase
MEKKELRVGRYTINWYAGINCASQIAAEISAWGYESLLIIADRTVWKIHGATLENALARCFPISVIQIAPGERNKTLSTLVRLTETALSVGTKPSSAVVTFGGGVTGNIGGMLAALLFRGLPLIHIPTTTVGIFDSALSIRQSVNSKSGKNAIGLYYSPRAVFCDLSYLATLPVKMLEEGLIELAKGILVGHRDAIPDFFRELRSDESGGQPNYQTLLKLAVKVKVDAISADPHETSAGLRLHYGHTIGHVLEHLSRGALSHGDAVVIGMTCAASISHKLGHLPQKELVLHQEVVLSASKKCNWDRTKLNESKVFALLSQDPKQRYLPAAPRHACFVLLDRVGHTVFTNRLPLVPVPFRCVRSVLREYGIVQ